jgi:hypothetical protein
MDYQISMLMMNRITAIGKNSDELNQKYIMKISSKLCRFHGQLCYHVLHEFMISKNEKSVSLIFEDFV